MSLDEKLKDRLPIAQRTEALEQLLVEQGLVDPAVMDNFIKMYEKDVGPLNGARVVSLADVWVAAQLPGDLFALAFDFIDDDGVRASQGGNPKLEHAHFVKGWLDLDSRDLVWDPAAGLPNHWRMKAVSTIVVDEVEEVPAAFEVGGMRRGG